MERTENDGAMHELRDALDDAIRRAWCEPVKGAVEGEDVEVVRVLRRAALISDPDQMRHLASIQAAAWTVVRERVS